MTTVMVNARVDRQDKLAADRVLADNRRTWSQAIQALAAYMRRNRALPAELVQAPPDEQAERNRAWDRFMSMAGISTNPDLATDEGSDQILYEEMMRRHG